MDKACLIDRVKRFNIVSKQALAYIEKQYAVDTGFRMINTNGFRRGIWDFPVRIPLTWEFLFNII